MTRLWLGWIVASLTMGSVSCSDDDDATDVVEEAEKARPELGSKGMECGEDKNCQNGLTCNPQNVCVACGECGVDETWVDGGIFSVTNLVKPLAAPLSLAILKPLDVLVNTSPPHILDVEPNKGAFRSGCFSVQQVSLGLGVLSDDIGFDGENGNLFPTYTGIKAWAKPNKWEDACVENTRVFAVQNAIVKRLVKNLGQDRFNPYTPEVPGEKTTLGFVMGFVLDKEMKPVEGARIQYQPSDSKEWFDFNEVNPVYFPMKNFKLSDQGGTTSAGMYLIPAPVGGKAGIVMLRPQKEGITWREVGFPSGANKGFCYFLNMVADE